MRGGFTLIEIAIVAIVSAIVLTLASLTFSGYFQRSSAQRAAQLFAQDLSAARSYAMRSREAVVMRVYESTDWYEIETVSGSYEIARRRFSGTGADIELSGITLNTIGDSVLFTSRGLAKFTIFGSVPPTATFSSGTVTYDVTFNGMGASRVLRN